jgi:hypothetical protein
LSNPDGGWSTNSGAITIDTFVVSDISPASATNATSSSAVPLTVTGQGIPGGNTTLRLTPAFTVTGQDPIVVNPTAIAANGQQWQGNANLASAAAGPYQVQLVNGTDTGTLTTKTFTITSAGAPTVTAVSPTIIGQGANATLTVTGTDFAHGATVTFSKAAFTTTGPVVFQSSTSLQVPVHVASNAATGSGNATNVTVTNTGPTPNAGTKTAALQAGAGPTISTLSPSALGQGATTTLTITGTNFDPHVVVTFGAGASANGAMTVTSTQIKVPVKVAPNAPAKVDVKVQNPDQGSATAQLTIDVVSLTGVTPRYVSNTYNGNLVLAGSGFRTGATVSFPAGSGVSVQTGKTATVTNNGATLTVPVVVSRSSAASVDVTVVNTGTDFGAVTCAGCLGVAVVPLPPANTSASKSGSVATVSWDAVVPPRDGGAPITSYTVSVTSPVNSGVAPQMLGPTVTTASFNNLDPGSDYVFAVTATNAANLTSAPASVSTSRASTLSLTASPSRVVSGQSVRLSGQLLAVDGRPITGATVVVHRRSDAGVGGTVGTATTDSSGRWSMVTRPRVNQSYAASFAGNGINTASTSASRRVVADARVSINGTSDRTTLTVFGHVRPAKAGETVRLVAIDAAGRLHHLGRAFLDGRSHYRFRVPQPNSGWRLQVRIGRTAQNGPGRSPFLVSG